MPSYPRGQVNIAEKDDRLFEFRCAATKRFSWFLLGIEFFENLDRHRLSSRKASLGVGSANQGGTRTASGVALTLRILIAAVIHLGER
jgi:hypothetical protein